MQVDIFLQHGKPSSFPSLVTAYWLPTWLGIEKAVLRSGSALDAKDKKTTKP
jgi:hypothetical protein